MAAKKKPFNKYTLTEAYQFLHLTHLKPWDILIDPIAPSALFNENLKRLESFDTSSSESGKEVLIDLILQEALSRHAQLKVWKEVS